MNRILRPLLLSLSLAVPALGQDAPKPANEVKFPSSEVTKEDASFKVKAPQPGEVRAEKGAMNVDMKMSIDMGGQVQEMNQKMSRVYEREVTITGAEADGTITSMKVKFSKYAEEQSMGGMGGMGGEDEKGSKLEGKTFTVETLDDGTHEVKDDAGAKVEDFFVRRQVQQAAEAVAKESKGGFHSALPKDGALTPGKKLELPEDTFRSILDMKNDKVKFEQKDMIYKGTREVGGKKCGMFDLRIKISEDSGRGPSMNMTMGGEVAIDLASGRVLLTDLAGKVSLSGSDPNGPSISGGGPVTVKIETSVK